MEQDELNRPDLIHTMTTINNPPPTIWNHTMATRTPDLLATALPILQGLLASGHYTDQDEEDGTPGVTHFGDTDIILAVKDAVDVAEDLIRECHERQSEQ